MYELDFTSAWWVYKSNAKQNHQLLIAVAEVGGWGNKSKDTGLLSRNLNLIGRKASAHGVFRYYDWLHKLKQIVWSACLRTNPREFITAEGLPAYKRSSAASIDIDIARFKFAVCPPDVSGTAAV